MKAKELFKKNKVEYVQNLLKLENIDISKKEILNFIWKNYKKIDNSHLIVLDNFIHAYNFTKSLPSLELDPDNLRKINSILCQGFTKYAGEYRVSNTTSYKGIFDKQDFLKTIDKINSSDNKLNKTIAYIIFAIAEHPFYKFNKASVFLSANAYLLRNNLGTLFVSDENLDSFNQSLFNYSKSQNLNNYKNLFLEIKKSFVSAR